MTITIPDTAEGLEDLLLDRTKMTEVLRDGQLKDVINAHVNIRMNKDPELLKQVNEQTQQVLTSWLKEHNQTHLPIPKDFSPLTANERNQARKNKLYNKKAPGASLDQTYADAAEFFQAVWHKTGTLGTERDKALAAKAASARTIQNAYGSQVPGDGGFLIPEVLRSELLMWSLEQSIIRPRATIIPMDSLRVPIPMVDSQTNVGSVFGGITAYWTEEGAALVESSATFGQVVLDAKKLTAFANVPNELVMDAPAFEGFFGQAFPAAIAFFEDLAFIKGSGVGEPAGSLFSATNPAIVAAAALAQPTNTIVYENLVAMYARMLPNSLNRGVWIASIDTFPQLATMALSVGTGGSAVWLGGGVVDGATGTPPVTILGRPVYFTEKTNTLGTQGDISFVDLSYYLIGDRQVMQASSSPHFQFNQDKTSYRVIERVDGRPWLQAPITPANGGPTLSPFVQLATRP